MSKEAIIKNISKEIVSDFGKRKFVDIKEMEVMVQTHIKNCLYDILNSNGRYLQETRQNLINKINKIESGYEKEKLKEQLFRLNIEIKKNNIIVSEIKDESEVKILARYVKDTMGVEFLNKLLNRDNKIQPNVHQ